MRPCTTQNSNELALAVLGKGSRKTVFSDIMRALGGDKEFIPYARKVLRVCYAPTVPPDKLYDRIRAVLPALEREKSLIISGISQNQKLENLTYVLSDGIFYYCTEHPNPAEGHAPYQGKVYVSRHWMERCKTAADRARVSEYIVRNGIKEAEWVIGPPVYMVTRRNCTHRLIRVPVDAVLSGDLKTPMPTVLALSEDISWQARKYLRRWNNLKALLKVMPDVEKLKKDTDRARLLYKKWARM